jgi:nitroreductase
MTTEKRLTMQLGTVMFTQRAIRRLKTDPIPDRDIRDVLEAAIRAPSGSNNQPWHFVVMKDPDVRTKFGQLYKEAWWAKRKDAGIRSPEDLPVNDPITQSATRLADDIGRAPVIILVCATAMGPGAMGSVIPATQNLLLAARSLGIGGTITTLHTTVEGRVRTLLEIPETVQIVYCVPLGYPRGKFGPTSRKPLDEVCSGDKWGHRLK